LSKEDEGDVDELLDDRNGLVEGIGVTKCRLREYKEGRDDPYGSQESGDDVQVVEERKF